MDNAKSKNLTIISKDADFSHRIIANNPPPKIIHIKIGNLRLKSLHHFIELAWDAVEKLSEKHKLANLFIDRIEAIK